MGINLYLINLATSVSLFAIFIFISGENIQSTMSKMKMLQGKITNVQKHKSKVFKALNDSVVPNYCKSIHIRNNHRTFSFNVVYSREKLQHCVGCKVHPGIVYDLLQSIAIPFIWTRHRTVWCYILGNCKCGNTATYQNSQCCEDNQLHV